MYPLNVAVVISQAQLWEEAQAILRDLPVRVAFEQLNVDDPVTFLDRIQRMAPDALLLDPATLNISLEELIRLVKATLAAPKVVILSDHAEPEAILTAMRSGASEYVYRPLDKSLKQALERISADIESAKTALSRSTGQNIGLLSVKGGCGATTLACLGAMELGERLEQTVLLADFDFLCGTVRLSMNMPVRYSVLDAINNVERLDASYWKALVSNGVPNLEVICGQPDQPLLELPTPHATRRVLRFIRSQYKWSVLDLGHGLTPQTTTLLEDIDQLAVVTTLEFRALQQTRETLRQLRETGIPRERIHLILNRVPRRSQITVDDVEEALGSKVFATIPNDFHALESAASESTILKKGHPVRAAVGRMFARLAKLEETEHKPRKLFTMFD